MMKGDLFGSTQQGTKEITVRQNGRSYVLKYTGKMDANDIRKFCRWAESADGVAFCHDAYHEILTGLERRRVLTKKAPQLSGYAISQWTRFIYGRSCGNTPGPLLGKLLVALHPELANLVKFKT